MCRAAIAIKRSFEPKTMEFAKKNPARAPIVRTHLKGPCHVSTQMEQPGGEWLAILSAPPDGFARAFARGAVLEASVLSAPMTGADAIGRFFAAARTLYDRIAFTRETVSERNTYLEWDGLYRGQPLAGLTILGRDAGGRVERVRLFHLPYWQLVAFSADLHRRLSNPEGEISCLA